MRISDIKYKAEELLRVDKVLILKVFIFIGLLSAVITYISNSVPGVVFGSLLSLLLTVGTLTLSQGYIVTSLKVVNNKYGEIDLEKDGLTGFYRFTKLFSTYFIHAFFLFTIIVILILLGFVIISGMISEGTMREIVNTFQLSMNSLVEPDLSVRALQELSNAVGFIALYTIFLVAIMILYSANFALTFFILEKHQIKGIDAMKESVVLMKGHKKTYCLLYLSFFGWMALALILEYVLFTMIPLSLFASVTGVIVSNVLYRAKLQISLAVLYEEIELTKEPKMRIVENGV
jgi:uncharacterized membrane protein